MRSGEEEEGRKRKEKERKEKEGKRRNKYIFDIKFIKFYLILIIKII